MVLGVRGFRGYHHGNEVLGVPDKLGYYAEFHILVILAISGVGLFSIGTKGETLCKRKGGPGAKVVLTARRERPAMRRVW